MAGGGRSDRPEKNSSVYYLLILRSLYVPETYSLRVRALVVYYLLDLLYSVLICDTCDSRAACKAEDHRIHIGRHFNRNDKIR